MQKMTALVLAAGLGVRMGPRGRLMPKGLMPVGGAAMVAQSVATLRARGVRRIRIVTGHLAGQYHAAFAGAEGVELLHNPAYATTGSLRTLMTGLDGIEGPCLILESDLIYAPQALDGLDGTGNRLVVSGATGAGDEVWVWADGAGRLRAMSKARGDHAAAPLGELVGITALSAAALPALREAAAEVLLRVPDEHYEPGIVALAQRLPVDCVLHGDLPWAEIDDEDMLARAERDVVPRIEAARRAGTG